MRQECVVVGFVAQLARARSNASPERREKPLQRHDLDGAVSARQPHLVDQRWRRRARRTRRVTRRRRTRHAETDADEARRCLHSRSVLRLRAGPRRLDVTRRCRRCCRCR